ncbi:M24 family metallopeptidase, partial [candidate division KSB1 bacterium]|nr:M24 family metallopeptidase [candidate division KSB1 bacterium]
YKHAITKTDTLKNYAMINICAKKWGLIIAVTRFVHFGELPAELSKNQEHVTDIYSAILANLKPGSKVADIFKNIKEVYNTHGFPEAWKQHHMGGAIGYKEREYKAYPGCDYIVMENQAFAWNPTLPGAKVEDTIIVTDGGVETLTYTGNWSYQTVEKSGQVFEVPQILVK